MKGEVGVVMWWVLGGKDSVLPWADVGGLATPNIFPPSTCQGKMQE